MSLETFKKLPRDKQDLILATGIHAFSRNSYTDVSTDTITRACKISKGILFHYFGSKKGFYLYCLETAMERLTEQTEPPEGTDFYEILFAAMNRKLSVCVQHPDEMHMVNMASRDASSEITRQKAEILQKYMAAVQRESAQTLNRAVAALPFSQQCDRRKTAEGLHIYINALLNKYLLQYQQTPDLFFRNSETIKGELKEYLDMMLYGICK